MTEAVTNAVRERLDRVGCQRGCGLADGLISIGKDCAARLKETSLQSLLSPDFDLHLTVDNSALVSWYGSARGSLNNPAILK